MPILKKDDVTPIRPVIVLLYGVAGTGKTSVATTSENPILIDTDRGFDRAARRVDTLTASKWEDVTDELQTIGTYKTVVIDTCKSCLDDFIAAYVVDKNYKLKTNALKRFGAMADEFKDFVASLRLKGTDIVFICHDKETAEGDVIRHSPDCTGQSKDLLIRIADQVGYMFMENGRRVINFQPTDTTIGKDTAGLGKVTLPNCDDPKFSGFMSGLIDNTKKSIQSKGEAQKEAIRLLEDAQSALQAATTEEDVSALVELSNRLAKVHQKPFKVEMVKVLAEKGFVLNDEKKFVRRDG